MTVPEPEARTKRVVRTERRQGPLRWGVAAVVAGIGLLVAGVVLGFGISAAELVGASGRAKVGDPVTFDAEAGDYAIVFVRGELDSEQLRDRAVGNLWCTAELADGSQRMIDGSDQAVYSVTELGTSVGTFTAVAGTTEVLCDWERDPGGILQNYVVAEQRTTAKIAVWVLLGAAILIGSLGGWLVAIGVRGRPVIERVPV